MKTLPKRALGRAFLPILVTLALAACGPTASPVDIVRQFIAAAQHGDAKTLHGLLAPDGALGSLLPMDPGGLTDLVHTVQADFPIAVPATIHPAREAGATTYVAVRLDFAPHALAQFRSVVWAAGADLQGLYFSAGLFGSAKWLPQSKDAKASAVPIAVLTRWLTTPPPAAASAIQELTALSKQAAAFGPEPLDLTMLSTGRHSTDYLAWQAKMAQLREHATPLVEQAIASATYAALTQHFPVDPTRRFYTRGYEFTVARESNGWRVTEYCTLHPSFHDTFPCRQQGH